MLPLLEFDLAWQHLEIVKFLSFLMFPGSSCPIITLYNKSKENKKHEARRTNSAVQMSSSNYLEGDTLTWVTRLGYCVSRPLPS